VRRAGLTFHDVFVAIWIECWLNALYQFAIAYAMAEYYISPQDAHGERDIGGGCCAVFDGFQVGLLMHSGSLAIGSALVAMFSVVELIVRIMEAQNKAENDNKIVECLLCILGSCVSCCKSIVEFINKNAYVDMAISSDNFCDSARKALQVIATLPGAMAILAGATLVFSVFGCLFVALGSAAFTFFLTTSSTFSAQDSAFYVEQPTMVAVVAGLIGGTVGLCFVLVLEMASDALLFYYGLDILDGRGGHNCPTQIKALVQDTHNNMQS